MTDKAADPKDLETLSRRKALARLGLVAGAAYVAPLIVGLNEAAAGHGGGDDGGGGSGGCPPGQRRRMGTCV